MKNIRLVDKDIYYVGASDYKAGKFENHIPIPRGMAYNSYLIIDEKTALFDASDAVVADAFLENVEEVLSGEKRDLDYLIVTHMEPDHSSSLKKILDKYPSSKVVYNKKTQTMFNQFFDISLAGREILVSDGDKISLGKHSLEFFFTPMVHWPEVMMCFESVSRILFSADAFGSFGALGGNLFDSEVLFADKIVIDEYRRYYTNIVGKYGPQVLKALERACKFPIAKICPLHGYVVTRNIGNLVNYYSFWASYTPEEKGVLVVYASMYDHTKTVALELASMLKDRGVNSVNVFDVSAQDATYLVSEAFRFSDIVLASVTHNNNIYILMEDFLSALIAQNIQNRNFYFIENGTWAPVSGKLMREKLQVLKNCSLSENVLTLKSSFKENNREMLNKIVEEIVEKVN